MRSLELEVERIIHKKVVSCLLPLLDHVPERGLEVNLQDVFHRFNFDTSCSIVMGFDPKCLTTLFQQFLYQKVFNEVSQVMFYRHVVRRCFWKLPKWLQVGQEKKMKEARKILDHFLQECITSKRKGLSKFLISENSDLHFLTALMVEEEKKGQVMDDKFLRDTASNLLSAGRDSITSGLTWFFWLVGRITFIDRS